MLGPSEELIVPQRPLVQESIPFIFYEPFPVNPFSTTTIINEGRVPNIFGRVRSLPEFAGRLNDWIHNLLQIRFVQDPSGEVSQSQQRMIVGWTQWLAPEVQEKIAKYLHDYRANERRSREIEATWEAANKDLGLKWFSLEATLRPLVEAVNFEYARLMWFTGRLWWEPMAKNKETGGLEAIPGSEETVKKASGADSLPMEKKLPPFSEEDMPLFLRTNWSRLQLLRDIIHNLATFGPPHPTMAWAIVQAMVKQWPPRQLAGLNTDTLALEVELIRYERGFLGKSVIKSFLRVESSGYITMKTKEFVFGLEVSFYTRVNIARNGQVTYDVEVFKIHSVSVTVTADQPTSLMGKFLGAIRRLFTKEKIGVGPEEIGAEKVGAAIRRFDLPT